MKTLKLAVVTASIDPEKTKEFWASWRNSAEHPFRKYTVINGGGGPHEALPVPGDPQDIYLYSPVVMGPVPAFTLGVEAAVRDGAELVACFHDDLRIDMTGWDTAVERFFRNSTKTLLAGFGGGIGLGREGMYEPARPCSVCGGDGVSIESLGVGERVVCSTCDGRGTVGGYDPMSLARHDFVSNMQDAEAHGTRVTQPVAVACLDGFAMIGRAEWFLSAWQYLRNKGVVHHAYDSWMGALAKRAGGVAFMLPVECHHAGGRTAVGNVEYQNWARSKNGAGDAGFWEASHRMMYEDCRGELPFRARG